MTPPQPPNADAAALWQALLGLRQAGATVSDSGDCASWVDVLSPALVADLVPELALDEALVRESRRYGQYQQARQLQALGWIAETGVACVGMKGFASAFLYYPTPASRLIGDLDLLVRRADLPAIVTALGSHGFRFGSTGESAWGFQSDASFVPFHSPDGDCNLDLHVQPDSYPLHLGLNVDQVFAAAREIMAVDRPVLVPSAQHIAMILVANLAKDKFAPWGLRKLLDLARLLRHEKDFDWRGLIETASRARLLRALDTTVALMRGLGTPEFLLPPELGRRYGRLLRGLVEDWRLQRPASLALRLQREWALAAEPGVALQLMARRVAGLVRSRSGVPDLAGKPPAA